MSKLFIVAVTAFFSISFCHEEHPFRRRTRLQRRKPLDYSRTTSSDSLYPRTIANLSCGFVEQPLNHFSLPRGNVPTYKQRYCVSNEFVLHPSNATVFLYTGNESPLEQYINNTGLVWELAETFNAQIVFVEHRYEGKSLPSPDTPNCMAYSSSIQALADYASFIERHLFSQKNTTIFTMERRPVIAFGGSYGGMLAAWIRMKYPNLIAGAIAGSAPIWGFPSNFPSKIDSAFQVIKRGLDQNYPPTKRGRSENNFCATNLLAAWPLIKYLGQAGPAGRSLLTDTFRLCSPLQENDVDDLIDWAQSPWFDLAEGSFPYPSSYVPFALTHNDRVKLPAWPLQAACWKYSELRQDHNVRFNGNMSEVRYNVSYGEGEFLLYVDWENVTLVGSSPSPGELRSLSTLLSNVREAVSIWYNITKDLPCYDLIPAPNSGENSTTEYIQADEPSSSQLREKTATDRQLHSDQNATEDCRSTIAKTGSWSALCCNEEMNLIITEAHGLGRDFLWPPSHPRGTMNHADVIDVGGNLTDEFCSDPLGHYGFPKDPPDPWSTWYDIVYGGVRLESHSNIIFSNGLLDPWSAAGVYSTDPTQTTDDLSTVAEVVIPGLYLQRINEHDLIALIMEYGGHHTDLMYSSDKDPPSIRKAREIEQGYIAKWIDEWWERPAQ
jgi:pimeloyl-ACP methyl ester carboxylesterase